MLSIQELKEAAGITAVELALNERLKNTAPVNIVLSTVGASLVFAYIYSQLRHKVRHLVLINKKLGYVLHSKIFLKILEYDNI